MKKINLFRFALLLTVVFVFASCAKDGDDGPQGPPGPAGPAGPQGVAGPAGPIGTANVIYSNWLDVSFQEDPDNAGNWQGQIVAAKLNNDIISKGEIKVYVNVNTPTEPVVLALPVHLAFTIVPIFEIGAITLLSDIDAGTETTAGEKYFQYRYVLIPGGAPARMATVDWNNYEAVKKYLNLKD